MAFLEEPEGGLGQMGAARAGADGGIPNWVAAFAWRPEFLDGWVGLLTPVRDRMDPRLYELVTLAAALTIKSSYCALAHGSVLMNQGMEADALERIARDPDRHDDAREREAMRYAAKVARDASSVGPGDIDALQGVGFTPAEITDIAAAAAMRCFFSKFLDALGVEADARFADLPESLRGALVLGRPPARG